jgi:multisubunit Na+/H+ antiporter MnhB subunit
MSDTGKHKAGAFDVRVVIAGLIGFYGVVLVLMGLFADPELEKTGGVNANLWTGIGLVVVALAFAAWARLRPVVVDEAELARARAEDGDRPAH